MHCAEAWFRLLARIRLLLKRSRSLGPLDVGKKEDVKTCLNSYQSAAHEYDKSNAHTVRMLHTVDSVKHNIVPLCFGKVEGVAQCLRRHFISAYKRK